MYPNETLNQYMKRRAQRYCPTALNDQNVEDLAWRELQEISQWIKHSEAKLVGFLAGATVYVGALITVVLNAANEERGPIRFLLLSAIIALVATIFAIYGLLPRSSLPQLDRSPPILSFHNIATAPDWTSYLEERKRLSMQADAYFDEIIKQSWSLAIVAMVKFNIARCCLRLLFVSLCLCGFSLLWMLANTF